MILIEETGYFNCSSVDSETTSNVPRVETCSNADTIPFHLFFNQGMQLFRRIRKATNVCKLVQRLFQKLAASQPQHTASLIQPESLLCPSLYINQNDDGPFGGAIPCFLHGDCVANGKLGYASFYDHVFSRIDNLELTVSGNKVFILPC